MIMVTPLNQETSNELLRFAYHEAGHAVAAFALGHVIECVVIDYDGPPREESGDHPRHFIRWSDEMLVEEMELPHAEARCLFAFAGDAAEMHLIGCRPAGERFDHGRDYWLAMAAAWYLFPENTLRHEFLNKLEQRAHAFVREPLRWKQIQTLASTLIDRREMTGTEVIELLKSTSATFDPPA